MRILGIDPGLAAVGWGLIVYPEGGPRDVRWGQIKTPSTQRLPQRLKCIHDTLRDLIDKERPEVVAIEQIFFATNVKTAIAVAQARGVALLATAELDVAVVEYTPLQIKKAVTGHGAAGKQQIQKLVATLLGLREIPKPDHAADALAAALCHGHTLKADRLIRSAR